MLLLLWFLFICLEKHLLNPYNSHFRFILEFEHASLQATHSRIRPPLQRRAGTSVSLKDQSLQSLQSLPSLAIPPILAILPNLPVLLESRKLPGLQESSIQSSSGAWVCSVITGNFLARKYSRSASQPPGIEHPLF